MVPASKTCDILLRQIHLDKHELVRHSLDALAHALTLVAASGLPRRLLLLHGAATLLIPYLHGKLRTYALSKAWPDAPSSDRRRKLWELLTSLESSYAAFSLANFVAFLWNGRYVDSSFSSPLFSEADVPQVSHNS